MKWLKSNILFFSITIIFIVIFLLPVIFNIFLFNWESPLANGDLKSWMSFTSTYYGSIIGGIISGTLTLFGVRYTIKKDEKSNFIKNYPHQKKNADDIIDELRYINHSIRIFNSSSKTKQDILDVKFVVIEYINKLDELLEKAAIVDSKLYEDIRLNFFEILKSVEANIKENEILNIEIDKEQMEVFEWVSGRSLDIAKSTSEKITNNFRKLTS